MEGDAAQTAQTIVGFANALTTAAFAATAIPGPAGLVIGGLTGLALVSNEVFKIFNDGKGILSLFTEQLSEGTIAQIEYNKSVREAAEEGGSAGIIKAAQRNARLEEIRTKGVTGESIVSEDKLQQKGLDGVASALAGVQFETQELRRVVNTDLLPSKDDTFFQSIGKAFITSGGGGSPIGGGMSTGTGAIQPRLVDVTKGLGGLTSEFAGLFADLSLDPAQELRDAGIDPAEQTALIDAVNDLQNKAIKAAIGNIQEEFDDGKISNLERAGIEALYAQAIVDIAEQFQIDLKALTETPDDGVARITGKEFGKRSRQALRIGGLRSQGFGVDTAQGPGGETVSFGLSQDPGLKTQLLEKELALSTEISTVNKNRLQDEIEGINFQISASSQRFKLAEDLTQKLIDQTTIEEESATKITERLQAGEGLVEIMQSLTEAEQASLSTNSELVEDFLEQADALELILAFEERRVANAKAIRDAQVSRSFADGLSDGMKSLENQTDAFNYKIGTEAPMRLANGLGSAMTQALSGAKSVSDALSEAGRNFLQYMIDAVMQQAAMLMMQRAMGAFGFGVYTGGPIKNFANGGGVSGSDTVPAMLAPGEFVMSKSAVDSVGQPYMQSLNAGQVPMGQTATAGSNVNNNVALSFNITQGEGNSKENPKRKEGEFNGDTGFVRKIRKSVVQIISEESRPGGALYSGR